MLRGFDLGRPKAWPDANKLLRRLTPRAPRLPPSNATHPWIAKILKALASPDEVPDPPCGCWGEMPDGIQYFEVPLGEGRKLLFVRIGQDEPLFDKQTLRVLPAS
ncbi:hypothetical protein EN925_23855 [Mesorhizobium sp. M7A.F.Ca.US.006.04.2.1]|nr:hypothetical protein EN990_05505 [Mesorhizobium sp. M7A.F.Ca.US.005.03.1.1]RUY18388.1 hypothetical protein EN991_04355 [Mesorhizobium sp. M7A.F.Ca.US.005.03.2.1]RUY24066.1 hypothetical protein EN979_27195 [Mesorhizobium sp. M7A.F.Ca.US.001.04.2.1]RUY40302.1 hypothetical protein EN978_18810 [Mesorhizobium sp. M7A.F.Ca.US.001.04.1.1]RUZ98525.1 hypothetical protein EN938_31300 [Mesorhizobium sp. M7A.F.Ca.US.001.02.1.1]RVA11653.1 hypothetical protein EN932_15165 [Mesorhizobium sp. M7A.F.Ca.US.0